MPVTSWSVINLHGPYKPMKHPLPTKNMPKLLPPHILDSDGKPYMIYCHECRQNCNNVEQFKYEEKELERGEENCQWNHKQTEHPTLPADNAGNEPASRTAQHRAILTGRQQINSGTLSRQQDKPPELLLYGAISSAAVMVGRQGDATAIQSRTCGAW